MTTEQIRMRDVLKDAMYLSWFKKTPLPVRGPRQPTFVVWVQAEAGGRWAMKKGFSTYPRAVNFALRVVKGRPDGMPPIHDWAVGCSSRWYPPPMKKVDSGRKRKVAVKDRRGRVIRHDLTPVIERVRLGMPPGHQWCGYCRRPTVFAWFTKHHALPQTSRLLQSEKRCTICGVRESFSKRGNR